MGDGRDLYRKDDGPLLVGDGQGGCSGQIVTVDAKLDKAMRAVGRQLWPGAFWEDLDDLAKEQCHHVARAVMEAING